MPPETPVRPSIVTQEPVVAYQAVAILLALALGAAGIVVDPSVIVTAIGGVVALVGVVLAAIKARSKVTPLADPYHK